MDVVLEAGAQDLKVDGDNFEITTEPKDFTPVRDALNTAGIAVDHAELTMVPGTTVKLGEDAARKILKLMDALDENDDIQNVSANFDIPDDILEKLRDEE